MFNAIINNTIRLPDRSDLTVRPLHTCTEVDSEERKFGCLSYQIVSVSRCNLKKKKTKKNKKLLCDLKVRVTL